MSAGFTPPGEPRKCCPVSSSSVRDDACRTCPKPSVSDVEPAMWATPANMRQLAHVATPGAQLIAYSPTTAERFSANAGDYWDMPVGMPLTDREGAPMVLAFVHEAITVVEATR